MTVAPAITIAADEFVRALKESVGGGEYQFHAASMNMDVTGSVDFGDLVKEFTKGLLIENVRFLDAVRMTNCRFVGSVSFKSCAFDHSLHLGKAKFENGLCFSDCTFGVAGKKLDRAALLLDDAKIRGDIAFYKTTVYGCVMARRLRLSGNLEFAACAFEAESKEVALLDLSNSKINGSINFETNKRPDALPQSLGESLGTIGTMRKSRLPRTRFANRKDSVSINLGGAEVTEDVILSCAHFIGRANLSTIKCRGLASEGRFFALPATESQHALPEQKTLVAGEGFGGAIIEGGLTLSGGQFGLIHLHGISISGEISLIDGHSGQIHVEDSICDGSDNERFVARTVLGNFVMIRWHCRDFVQLHPSEMKGSANVWGIRGIVINSTKIDRALSLWPGLSLQRVLQTHMGQSGADKPRPKFFSYNVDGKLIDAETDAGCRKLLNRWQRQLLVCGNVMIDHTAIGDDLVLTGIDVRENIGLSDGRIEILNSKIDGEVIFRSPISFLADSRMTAPLLHLLARRIVVESHGQTPAFGRAICHTLDMRGMEAKKVDLTGLCIREPPEQDSNTSPNPASRPLAQSTLNVPNATLSQTKVSGRVATFARLANSAAKRIYAEVDAVLNEPIRDSGKEIHVDPGPQQRNWERELLEICFGPLAPSIQEPSKHLEASTHIPGALDFQHAEIGELVISDASFRNHGSDRHVTENGIVLDYAQISKFYVARSEPDHANPHQHNGFPVPVSLADLSVKSWFLEDEDVHDSLPDLKSYIERETTLAVPYLDLLDNDHVFRMSSYLAVEKSLRDRGYTEEARQIFIAGVYRDVRTKSAGETKSQESKTWRRGDGRFRKPAASNLVLGLLCLALVAATISLGTQSLTRNFQLSVLGASLVLLGLFALRANVFRLKRPWREYGEFVICAAWCAAVIYAIHLVAVFMAGASQFAFEWLSLGLVVLLGIGIAMSGALRRFVDQLYWSLVDYGTSAWRLAGVIFILMAVSFALVSPAPQNFAPTLLAQSAPATQQKKPVTDAPSDWPFGARLWMTLRYHVPLVGAVISDEWQPADQPVIIVGTKGCNASTAPLSFVCDHWPTARDWFGFMMWANWILWPLFLPFLIRTLSRER